MNLKYLLQVVLCSVEKLPILCTPPPTMEPKVNVSGLYFKLTSCLFQTP